MARESSAWSLEVKTEGMSDYVEIGQYTDGLQTVSEDDGQTVVSQPGGTKATSNELSDRKNHVRSIEVRENDVTSPLFWRRGVHTIDYRWSKEGKGSGKPLETASGLYYRDRTVSATEPNELSVTIEVNGTTNITTH